MAAVSGPQPAPLFATSPPEGFSNHRAGRLDSGHLLRQVEMPASGDNGQPGRKIRADYYQSAAAGPRPLIIVLPIWNSSSYPPEKITAGIRSRLPHLHVLRLHGDKPLLDWEAVAAATTDAEAEAAIAGLADRLTVAVRDIRRIVAWGAARPEVDGEAFGLIGFSIGAIVGGIAMANEPALQAGVLVMGGGRPADIAMVCGGRRAEARRNLLEGLGWQPERYRRALQSAFAPLAATYPPGKADPRRVLIIDSARDDCIPPASRTDLRQRMGQPERITYLYTHTGAFYAMTPLGLNLMRRQIYEFLRQRFPQE